MRGERTTIRGFTGEMYHTEEILLTEDNYPFTVVFNYGVQLFQIAGHDWIHDQVVALIRSYQQGLEAGNEQGRDYIRAEFRALMGVASTDGLAR